MRANIRIKFLRRQALGAGIKREEDRDETQGTSGIHTEGKAVPEGMQTSTWRLSGTGSVFGASTNQVVQRSLAANPMFLQNL